MEGLGAMVEVHNSRQNERSRHEVSKPYAPLAKTVAVHSCLRLEQLPRKRGSELARHVPAANHKSERKGKPCCQKQLVPAPYKQDDEGTYAGGDEHAVSAVFDSLDFVHGVAMKEGRSCCDAAWRLTFDM